MNFRHSLRRRNPSPFSRAWRGRLLGLELLESRVLLSANFGLGMHAFLPLVMPVSADNALSAANLTPASPAIPATILKITISGPASVSENATATFMATATYTDKSTVDVTSSVTWSSTSPNAIIGAAGVLSVGAISKNASTYVAAILLDSKTGKTFKAGKTVSLKNIQEVTALTITGPAQVWENGHAQYKLMAAFDDGTKKNVTKNASWTQTSAHASIEPLSGYFQVGPLTADDASTLTAAYGGMQGLYNVTLKNIREVVAVTVSGATEVLEGDSTAYLATATYDDGAVVDVTHQALFIFRGSPHGHMSLGSVLSVPAHSITKDEFGNVFANYGGVEGELQGTVTLKNVKEVVKLAVTGTPALYEGGSGNYQATGTYDDGSTVDLTHNVTWTAAAPAAIDGFGHLTVPDKTMTRNLKVYVQAVYLDPVLHTILKNGAYVAVTNVQELQSLTVTGANSINAPGSAPYKATAKYDDGTSKDVTTLAAWSQTCADADITAGGVLSVNPLVVDETTTVTATWNMQGQKVVQLKAPAMPGELAYSGQFYVHYVPEFPSNPQAPAPGAVSFNLTLWMHKMTTTAGMQIYRIDKVMSDDSYFGCLTPAALAASTLWSLPYPSGDSAYSGDMPIIVFPNGATLATYGGVHMSPDGSIIGSRGTPDSTWQAGSAGGASYWSTHVPEYVNFDVWTWTLTRI